VPDRIGAGWRMRWPRLLFAVVCGLLFAAAFPPYGLWPLAVLAVCGFTLAVFGAGVRQGGLLGLGFGLAFFLGLFSWMLVIGPDAWVALAVLEALFLALLGAALAAVVRLPAWPLWASCLWVGSELLRARIPFGGLPWGRVAFSQTSSPFTSYAAWGGAPLVTFVTALCGTLAAYALLRLRAAPAMAAVGVAGVAAAGTLGYLIPLDSGGGRQVTVAVVQGNVPRIGLDFQGQREAVLRNHTTATERFAGSVRAGEMPRPELVIWPENSTDIDPYADAQAGRLISDAVRAIGVPTLVGAVVTGPDPEHVQNVGIVWDPVTGPGETYIKRHPVPFGEYIPFRSLLAQLITRLDRIPRDFYPGREPGVLTVGPARLGDVICFEIAYDNIVRDATNAGGQILVVQTNNATYGRTGQPEQQLALSQLRAVEHGRAVVIAATSGISAIVAPDGKIVDRSPEFTADVMVRAVPVRNTRTIADRVGAAPEWLLAAVGALALFVCAVRARRRPEAPDEPPRGDQPVDNAPQLTASTETPGKVGT
jgi:apolipoprotein N-acyltransferase